MKYAIISDVHGNIDALAAVLEDAKNFNIDKYIFAGDYCASFPEPNEVINTIRGIKNAIIVRGNEEENMRALAKQDQSTWIDGQFQALYWLYRTLTDENHAYTNSLPKNAVYYDGDTKLMVQHKSMDLYGDIEYKEFSSHKVVKKYNNDSYQRDKILQDFQEWVKTSNEFHAAIEPLTDGIYIFGHTHVQWHARYKNKIFINPGSCGLPLDGTWDAPYTLLNIEDDQINITERRVPYDAEKLAQKLKNSDLYKAAPVWSEIILEEMNVKFELALTFLQFVESYANEINDPIRPYSVKTWTDAFDLWKKKNEAKP